MPQIVPRIKASLYDILHVSVLLIVARTELSANSEGETFGGVRYYRYMWRSVLQRRSFIAGSLMKEPAITT